MAIKSERVQKALQLSNTKFKRLFGVKIETFGRMLEILQVAFDDLHKQGGKPLTKLQVADKLLLTLQYWREYRTMEHLGYEYGVVKSAVHSAMVWVENTLIRKRPKKTEKILFRQEETPYDQVAIDCRSKNKTDIKC